MVKTSRAGIVAIVVTLVSGCQTEAPVNLPGGSGKAEEKACAEPPACDASNDGTSFFDSCTNEELCAFGANCNYINDVTCVDGFWTYLTDTGNERVCGGIPCN